VKVPCHSRKYGRVDGSAELELCRFDSCPCTNLNRGNKMASKKITSVEAEELIENHEVDKIEGYEHRWSRNITSIVKIGNSFFSVKWDRGLTEIQEDYYPEQEIFEVKQEEKTVVKKEWVRVA